MFGVGMACESEARGKADKVANLGRRADRDADEVKVVSLRSPGATLDEIRGNRDGGTADLALKTESLRDGETGRSSIDLENESICQYERLETVRISAHIRPNRNAVRLRASGFGPRTSSEQSFSESS